MAAGHSPVLPSPCSSDARKGAYPPGYRREPSSDGAAWIAGRPVSSSSLPGRLSLCDRWRVGLAACVAPAPGTGASRPPQSRCGPPPSGLHWLNHARGWPPPRAGVTEARGPLRPRHRWSLWIVGRWPVSIPRFPGGAAPWDPPFAGVVHGVRTPLPRAVCRSPPAPVRAFLRRDPLRADRCPRGFQWGQLDGHDLRSPGAPGRRRRGRALVSPLPAQLVYILALHSWGASGPSRGSTSASPEVGPAGGKPSYLVDSASSHMLVSKIKPCMSKYKQFVL